MSIGFVFILICGISFTTIYLHRTGVVAASAMSATTMFLGYTNDSTEGRLALFRFSNASPIPIQRSYFYAIDFQSPTGWIGQFTHAFPSQGPSSISWHRFGPVLRPGKSEIVAVSTPSTQNCWRVSFPYVEAKNRAFRIAAEKIPSLNEHGILTNYAWSDPTKYWSHSDKIDP